ncbi:glycosyltransferase family 4 protein [Anoxynatronum buryatiense]|uniref:Galacturonosyltransferase n=1 Tax=Anoxynatronum buryatiense TaxID=489973 RepID=A0AA45WWC5_9CLOT|nr:glycosyltransferase family 4 protein [Anoxynatronum buryatiense]SMP56700.1 galacturonosyltransferase [Anoxynatronum buryatiense]
MDSNRRILILSNHHSYTYNFRKEVIQKLLDEGYEIYITLPYGEKVKRLEAMGCSYIESPLDRRGMNPVSDLRLMKSYYGLMKKIRPKLVLSYTIKPNIYGGIICRILKIPIIANVTGLGTAVGNEGVLQKIVVALYKSAFKKATCIFFQNESNRDFFIKKGISLNRYKVIPGSGININDFSYRDYPNDSGIVRFLYIGRIMKDKGIEELIEAAKRIKKDHENVHFDALGFCEDGYKEKVDFLQKNKLITFHGVIDNVRDYIEKCNAVIHPTYHEGMSNVLLEAAATGRPVLASEIPGCREIFDEGVSGFGFEAKNIDSLTQAILKFMKLSNQERMKMGIAGRRKIEKEFDRTIIVEEYLKEISRVTEGR